MKSLAPSYYPDEITLIKDGKELVAKRNPGSVIDLVGFIVEADDKIYRIITPNWVPYVKTFLAHPKLEDFFDAGLVRTEISTAQTDDYSLILEHEKFPYQSLPQEWAPNMLKEAAQTICRLGALLYKEGYSYKDGNISNLTFMHSKPTFFDLGSIIPIDTLPNSPKGFPLEFSGGFISQTAPYLELHTNNITKRGMFEVREKHMDNVVVFFQTMIEYLDTADYKVPVTEWIGYGGKFFNYENLNPKQQSVYTALRTYYKLGMKTLVDIGGSKGAFSEPAADLGYDCVTFDLDTTSVMTLYERVKREQRTITPLLMDFLKMTPYIRGFGTAGERFKSDVSLYLAVTHHLSLGLEISLDEQVKRLDELTDHYCIVEFIPTNDIHFRGEWKKPTEYTVDGFTTAMGKYDFRLIDNLPSAPDPRRILVYERINDV